MDPTARRRRRTAVTRLVRLGDEDAFDAEFWDAAGPDARVAAVWEMVLDYHALRGSHEHQPGLRGPVRRVRMRVRKPGVGVRTKRRRDPRRGT
jgi:hypothetical protein